MRVSIRELKNRLSGYLDMVEQGNEVIVTDRGRPVARLVPLREIPAGSEAFLARLEELPWVRPGQRDSPIGLADPEALCPGATSTVSQIVLDDRE